MLAWQPLFGASLRIGWEETERLTSADLSRLLEWSNQERRLEWKNAFAKR